jgi:hypothetical protein
MKLRWVVAALSVALLPTSTARAQSSSCQADRTESDLRLGGRAPGATPFYFEAEGEWLGANEEEGFVVIELGDEGPVEFPLDAEYRFQADKRTRLHGVRDARLDDLQRGDRVWVRFNSLDGRVVRLKLKRSPHS